MTISPISTTLLSIISCSLFYKESVKIINLNLVELLEEAKKQAVFPLAFSVIKKEAQLCLDNKTFSDYYQLYMEMIISNTQNFADHDELNEILSKNHISYCILKGFSSAAYYPCPCLRTMGDVDFLINKKDAEQVQDILKKLGFVSDDKILKGYHIAYYRENRSIWELHCGINGVPKNPVGVAIEKEIQSIYETALIHEIDSFQCMIPDRYHHGLIILLHTVAHLTHEGIGLRHLCDWASFVNTFENNDFEKMFKIKLKSFGLWKFAVILTKLCVEYLGMPNQDWINDSNCLNAETSNLLKRLIQDIMNSGNFGSKDFNRYREIKYIANEDKTVDSKRLLPQLFSSLNYKVYYNHKIIDRNRILLPIGWIIESFKYIILLATRKRKINNTKKMFIEASQRKVLYNEFDLFKTRYE